MSGGGNMERVLRLMAEKNASDVYLSANSPILIKINGQLLQLSDQPLTHSQPRQLLAELLTPSQLEELDDTGELNMSIGLPGVGSFRLSGFKQRGSIAAVFRCIPVVIPTLESLNVPSVLNTLILEKRGLILMVGATGTGKTVTLQRMAEAFSRIGVPVFGWGSTPTLLRHRRHPAAEASKRTSACTAASLLGTGAMSVVGTTSSPVRRTRRSSMATAGTPQAAAQSCRGLIAAQARSRRPPGS